VTETANVQLKEAYTRGQEVIREEIAPRMHEAAETIKEKAKSAAGTVEEKTKEVAEKLKGEEGKREEGSPMEVEKTKEWTHEWKAEGTTKKQEVTETDIQNVPFGSYQPM
jgi:hypothetical protein